MLLRLRPPSSVTVDDVLDPHAESPAQVDPRLDRKAHPGRQRAGLPLDHVRRLVAHQPDPVAGAVDEPVAVAGVGDQPPRGAIDLLARRPRAHCLEPRRVGARDHVVDLALLGGRLADVDGAGDVGGVAALDAAEVEHDHVALLDLSTRDLVVGVGAVRPGPHQRELDLGVAVLAQQVGEVGSDVELAAAREPDPQEVSEDGIQRGGAGGEQLELVGVLDRPQHRQRGGHRHVAGAGQLLLETEHVHRPRGVGYRVTAVGRQQLRRRLVGILAVAPFAHDQRAGAWGRLGVGPLDHGNDHRRLAAGLDREQRDPLGDRDRRVAGEVLQVRTGRHQHAGQAGPGRRVGGTRHPPGVVLGAERSGRSHGAEA